MNLKLLNLTKAIIALSLIITFFCEASQSPQSRSQSKSPIRVHVESTPTSEDDDNNRGRSQIRSNTSGSRPASTDSKGKGKEKISNNIENVNEVEEQKEDSPEVLQGIISRLKRDLDEQGKKLRKDLEEAADKAEKEKEILDAKLKKKQAKLDKINPNIVFQTEHAAPKKGTKTDEAAGKYWSAKANELSRKDSTYGQLKSFLSTMHKLYGPAALQPVITELRQDCLYKTRHEAREERIETLTEENHRLNNQNTRASEVSTRLGSTLQFCLSEAGKGRPECVYTHPDRKKDPGYKPTTLDQLLEVHKKDMDNLYNEEFPPKPVAKPPVKTPVKPATPQKK